MADTRTSSSNILLAVVALAALIGVALLFRGCSENAVDVRVVPVVHADLSNMVRTNGKVEAVDDFQAHAAAPGTIKKIYVSVGQHVGKDQVLLEFDDSEARRQVAAAQANLAGAQNTLSNMKQGGTSEERSTSAADVQNARAQLDQANASLAAVQKLSTLGSASSNEVASAKQRQTDAKVRIDQLQANSASRYSKSDLGAQQSQISGARASLNAASSGLSSYIIRAPFAGTVYDLAVNNYDYVQTGGDLLDVADLNLLQVRAYFDEPEVGKLARGQPVKITWDAKPDQVWHGHITLPPTDIKNYGTRNVGECVIAVDDAHGDLLPNTNVTVSVTTSQKFNVLTIPREALHAMNGSSYVYVVQGHELHRRPVEVGSVTLTRVEIISGLQDGQSVVLSAMDNSDLNDGEQVKVQK